MDLGGLDISKLMGPGGDLKMGETTEQTQTAAGLAALQESQSQAGEGGEQQINQGSPNLPPPSIGLLKEFFSQELSLEEIEEALKFITESEEFETYARKNLNLDSKSPAERLKEIIDEYFSDEEGVPVEVLLRKALAKMLEMLLSGNPDLSADLGGLFNRVQSQVVNNSVPEGKFAMEAIKQFFASTGVEADEQMIADEFLAALKTTFENEEKVFSLDSPFLKTAVEEVTMEYLIKSGMSAEEAENFISEQLPALTIGSEFNNWLGGVSTAQVQDIPPPPPVVNTEAVDELSAELTALLDAPTLGPGKISILEFMKMVKEAIQELEDLINEIILQDLELQKSQRLSQLEVIDAAAALFMGGEINPEDIEKFLAGDESLDSATKMQIEMLAEEGELQELRDKKAAGENIEGATRSLADKINERLDNYSGSAALVLLDILDAFVKMKEAEAAEKNEQADAAASDGQGDIISNYTEEVTKIVNEMLQKLTGLVNLGTIEMESLSQFGKAIDKLMEQLKGEDQAGGKDLLRSLAELISAKLGGPGGLEQKVAGLDVSSMVQALLATGNKGVNEMSGGTSSQMITAYLDDAAINALMIASFLQGAGMLESGEGTTELGQLSGVAVTIGLVASLLGGGASVSDVKDVLNSLQNISSSVASTGFAGFLGGAIADSQGLSEGDQAALTGILSGILSSVGKTSNEEETEATGEIVKQLRQLLKALEQVLQNLLAGVSNGSIPLEGIGAAVAAGVGEAVGAFVGGVSGSSGQDLDQLIQQLSGALQGQLTTNAASPEATQFLVNAMLAAGMGPAQMGGPQMAA